MTDNTEFSDYTPAYNWTCPRLDCRKYIVAWTQRGLNEFVESHMHSHRKEDKELTRSSAIAITTQPRDYDILKMTTSDIAFLKTRHIKIDDHVEHDSCLDSLSVSDREAIQELSMRQWIRALDSAWLLIPPGDQDGPK